MLAGADPNYTTDLLGNAPALCIFAHEGCTDMVALLLEFGASVKTTNSQGSTALVLAATRGHMHVVTQLVAAGAPLGTTDTAGRSVDKVSKSRNLRYSYHYSSKRFKPSHKLRSL